MAHYDIFREQLGIKYPAYGQALWEPSPGTLYSYVEVGDVGYVREGKFHRLFNALLPGDHPSHSTFGVPEYHEPLTPYPSTHIDTLTRSSDSYYSQGIVVDTEPENVTIRPDDVGQVSYMCQKKKHGAVLYLPVHARRQDTIARGHFREWIVKHIESWFAFAEKLKLGLVHMGEIILVTGCDRTRSWLNVAFPESDTDSRVSFGVDVTTLIRDDGPEVSINWRFSPERNHGAVLSRGPVGQNLPEDQCVFVRGYRVTRAPKTRPKDIKAAAEPLLDPGEHDGESELELTSIPTITGHRDPLHVLSEYIAQRVPDCDLVLVHDDDLARISKNCDNDEIVRSDTVIQLCQKYQPEIRQVLYDRPYTDRHNTKSGTEATKVAMFSEEFQIWARDPSLFSGQENYELSDSLPPTESVQSSAHQTEPHDFGASTNAPAHKDTHISSSQDPPPYSSLLSDIECYAWFVAADKDGNGLLSPEDLRNGLLNKGGMSFSMRTVKHLIDTYDLDGKGRIGFEEFVRLVDYVTQWRQMFYAFDFDNDGRIDANELSEALAHYNLHVGPHTLNMLVKKYGITPPSNEKTSYPLRIQMDLDHFMCACIVVKQTYVLYDSCSAAGLRQSWISRDAFIESVISLP